jgi:hypothetical protein
MVPPNDDGDHDAAAGGGGGGQFLDLDTGSTPTTTNPTFSS